MTTPGSARASRSITPLQINQLEIDETIPKRANYIPMHSKVTAVAIFYCWTGNPNDGQRRRGRKSKWAGAAGVGRPRRDRWRQHAADASRQTLSRTESGSVIATCAFSRSAAPPSISFDRADSGDADDGLSLAFMCAADIWSCLEDELRKIRDGPFTRYIPDLDCNTLHTRYPLPLAFRHLLKSDDQSTADDHPVAKDEEAVLQVVLSVLEVGREEFDFERPILSHGLDSLSATRLSSALQPFLPVSQVQLLAGLCLSELSANLKIRWQDSETQHHTAQEMVKESGDRLGNAEVLVFWVIFVWPLELRRSRSSLASTKATPTPLRSKWSLIHSTGTARHSSYTAHLCASATKIQTQMTYLPFFPRDHTEHSVLPFALVHFALKNAAREPCLEIFLSFDSPLLSILVSVIVIAQA
ncbi:hypothetical protein B0H14DRAFT_3644090 [Mycena olivaceomarginata]|nr:hypothetical protein B0H14DRAFT_3644090 [Mycena olivaceomarginata]